MLCNCSIRVTVVLGVSQSPHKLATEIRRNEAKEISQKRGHGRCSVAIKITLKKPCQKRGVVDVNFIFQSIKMAATRPHAVTPSFLLVSCT